MLIKYIIISIIGSITNLLPISYSTHIFIFQNLFNTKIFEDNLLINSIYLAIPISIIYTYKKDILKTLLLPIKKEKSNIRKKLKNLLLLFLTSLLSTIIILKIPSIKKNISSIPIYLLILSIILLLSNNKKGQKTSLTIIDSIIISISHFLNIIPTISPLCSNLLILKLLNYNKSTTIKLSLLTLIPLYIIKSLNTITNIITTNHLPYYLLVILISTLINIKIINYLKDIYYNNKIYKLSIYTTILSLFLLYWYR